MFNIRRRTSLQVSCVFYMFCIIDSQSAKFKAPDVSGDICKPVDNSPCHCRTDDGFEVNLQPLIQGQGKDTPLFKDYTSSLVGDKYTYSFNPCAPFSETETTCTNVAICQSLKESATSYALASYTNGTIKFVGDPRQNQTELHFTYSDRESESCDTKDRQSIISLKCADQTVFTVTGEEKIKCHYKFELQSKYICNQAAPPASNKLSIGSILLIVFFVGLFVYFVAGFLILRYARGARGVEQIPNLEFWTELPGLIKDGFVFVIGCCKKDTTYEKI